MHWIGRVRIGYARAHRVDAIDDVVERELFGEAPLNEVHGEHVGERLREDLRRLGEVLLPLQERAHKMMLRSLERLR